MLLETLHDTEDVPDSLQMIDSAIVCAHHCAAGAKGAHKEGLGRSKGGFTSKIHLRANAGGLPVAAGIAGGEVSDDKGCAPVMAGGPQPKVLLADRGYDADYIREDMAQRGGVAIIPTRKNHTVQIPVDSHIYALGNQVERCFNRLKRGLYP